MLLLLDAALQCCCEPVIENETSLCAQSFFGWSHCSSAALSSRIKMKTSLARRLLLLTAICLAFSCLVAVSAADTDAPSSSTAAANTTTTEVASEDDKQQDEAENVAEHPFLQVYGLINGSWIKFFVIVVAASRLAVIFPRFGLPLITGYMIIGCLCGPYVLGLVTKPQIPDLSYVTQTALAFIAYSAGSELYLPELRSLIRTIALITGFNALFSYIFCTLFIYLIAAAGLVPWMTPYMGSCAFSISLIAGAIMVARSPASAIAVVRELRAKGPATSIMLGVTVVGDVVVLVLFTLSNSFALANCGGGGFEGGAFFITLLTLCCAVLLGYGLGFILIFLLWIPPLRIGSFSIPIPAKFTILPLGFLIFVGCDWIVMWTEHHWGVGLNFDALLICITAGYVVTNKSHNRLAFLKMLGGMSGYIFMPFFTLVGVQLNLEILVQSIAFGFLVFAMRGLCIICGSFIGGTLAGLDRDKRMKMWMTMLAQAGVSLGLAAEVAVKFPEWGSKFQTTIISVVLINQFAGPVMCKYALKAFGEAGKMQEGEEEHGHDEHDDTPKPLKRAIMCGVDSTTLAIAAKLLKAGWRVSLMDEKKSNLILAKCLGIAKKDTNSTIDGSASANNNEPSVSETSSLVVAEDGSSSSSSSSISINMPADSSSSSSSSSVPTPFGKEPLLDLYLVAKDKTNTGSVAPRFSTALPESDIKSIDVVIVSLSNDVLTYEVASYMARARHALRVIVRVQNPAWMDLYQTNGLLPISSFSVAAQTIFAAATSRGNLQVVSNTLTLVDALKALSTDSVDDLQHLTLPMSGPDRLEWEEAHPAPSAEILEMISKNLRAAGVDDSIASASINFTATVTHGQRGEYIDNLHRLHDYHANDLSDADKAKNNDLFVGPAGVALQAEQAKQRAKEEQERNEEEETRAVEMALSQGQQQQQP